MKKICDMLQNINDCMAGFGFQQKLVIGDDNLRITEKEVIIVIPFSLTLKLPKDELSGNDADISRAVSQAISRTVSLNK